LYHYAAGILSACRAKAMEAAPAKLSYKWKRVEISQRLRTRFSFCETFRASYVDRILLTASENGKRTDRGDVGWNKVEGSSSSTVLEKRAAACLPEEQIADQLAQVG
jgi:hypothetical protein